MNQDKREEDPVQLTAAVREGDGAAFERLLDLYAPLLAASVSSFRDSAREEELMQEARYALYRAALGFRRDCGVTFGLYAKVCIRNALISDVRRGKSGKSPYSLDELCDGGQYPQDESVRSDDILDDLIHTETVEMLCRQIAQVLSPYERRVFELYANSYSVAEIAVKMSKSEKSVSNAISRFSAKLRKLRRQDP